MRQAARATFTSHPHGEAFLHSEDRGPHPRPRTVFCAHQTFHHHISALHLCMMAVHRRLSQHIITNPLPPLLILPWAQSFLWALD